MTKLEQVARAIAQARFSWLEQHGPYSDDPIGDEVPAEILAKAAIQAMREPTDEMIDAGIDQMDRFGSLTTVIHAMFNGMVDKALAEGGE